MTGALTSELMSPDIRKVVDPWPRVVALLARYPLAREIFQRVMADYRARQAADLAA